MIISAIKNAIKKFYGMLFVLIIQAIFMFFWRYGFSHFSQLLLRILIACGVFVAVLLVMGVPLEYSRLKKQAANLPASNNE